MKTSDFLAAMIKAGINSDYLSQRNKVFTIKRSYYWGSLKSGDEYASNIQKKLEAVGVHCRIEDSGNHFHGFVGGAKSGSAQDSYLWAKFVVAEVVPVVENKTP